MDETIRIILDYVEENLPEPQRNWPSYVFEERCYSRWAADELIDRISTNPFKSPDILIEDFILEMVMYSSADSRRDERYTIAAITAENILSLL